jgi:hypothetical protein
MVDSPPGKQLSLDKSLIFVVLLLFLPRFIRYAGDSYRPKALELSEFPRVVNLFLTPKISINQLREVKIAVITTAIGKSEKSTKVNVPQTLPAHYYCFTDNSELRNAGNWTMDYTPYHLSNLSKIDTGNYRNSRIRNSHTYMLHKFYKMQFHLIPRLQRYEMIVWMDITMALIKSDMLENLWMIFNFLIIF